jgi:hypothetical protein
VASQPPAGQRKSALRSPITWLIILGVGLAAGAYFLYRRSQSSSAAGTSTSTAATPSGTVSPDWSGEIATLQTEIMDLQSSEAQDESAEDKTAPAAAQVTVPDVVGQPQEAAFAILAAAGFKSKGSPVQKGKTLVVDSQSPKAGAKADRGSTVTLTSKPQAAKKTAAPLRVSSKPPITTPAGSMHKRKAA